VELIWNGTSCIHILTWPHLRALYFEGEFAFTWSQLMTIFHLENVQIFEFQFVQFIHKTLAKEEVHHKVIHHL